MVALEGVDTVVTVGVVTVGVVTVARNIIRGTEPRAVNF